MIVSASRRTDIPRFYLDWFVNRLKEGYVLVRNPMNHQQVSEIKLNSDVVDCIAFWSKNPAPLLEHLPRLEAYPWYVQFTLNPYGQAVERALPPADVLLGTFRQLADALGPRRVVWRFSPVLLGAEYTPAFHVAAFAKLAQALEGYTEQVRISYLDVYPKIKGRMEEMGLRDATRAEKMALTAEMLALAQKHGMRLGACGNLDIKAAGLEFTGCIDAGLVAQIVGQPMQVPRDAGQRSTCYCAASVDVGAYNTCLNGCAYCYANFSGAAARRSYARYDPAAPMLCGEVGPGDVVREKKMKSCREAQLRFY